MNIVTQSIVRLARGAWSAPMLPSQFATIVIARALAEHGKLSPIRAQVDGSGLAAEAARLGALSDTPWPGCIWLAPDRCGVVVELDGEIMRSVESDGRAVGEWLRPVSLATLGFLDPGMLVAR